MATTKPEGAAAKKFISPKGHIRDRIRIHQTPEIPKQGIFISLNGYAFQVSPEKEIDIPRPVRLMMDTLKYTDILKDPETGEEYEQTRLRYPYTLIKEDVGEPKIPSPEPPPGDQAEAGA